MNTEDGKASPERGGAERSEAKGSEIWEDPSVSIAGSLTAPLSGEPWTGGTGMHPRNEKLLQNARNLRKAMTKEERHLWYDFLKEYPVRFRRQEIIGDYIADFYCSAAALVVELDGSQHYEEEERERDLERTRYLESIGLTVIRFSNLDVLCNFRGVCEQIDAVVQGKTPQSASQAR